MKNKKGNVAIIAIIIVIVAITAGVIGWLLATKNQAPAQQAAAQPAPVKSVTQTQPAATQPTAPAQSADETADWQTYSNKMFEYSLKVPKEYAIASLGDNVLSLPNGEHPKDSSASISGNYNGEKIIINLHSEDNYVPNGGCYQSGDFVKTIILDSNKESICKDLNSGMYGDFYIAIGQKNTVISIAGDKDKTEQTQTIFEKIISTFKFTK